MRRSRLTFLAAIAAVGLLAASSVGTVAQGGIDAAAATITIDGNASDWADIEGTTVTLEQLDFGRHSEADTQELDFGFVDPIDVTFKVANDAENIYLLMEVPAAYDYVADDHSFSPAIAVQARIVSEASSHMGADEADFIASTGMVDIWHWELDCGPGELSGGAAVEGGVTGTGNDPCNFDDEVSTTPEKREDDGGMEEAPNDAAENSLLGSWSHTATEIGGDGSWVFEMSRPLATGDPEDAQWEAGGIAELALAWWDPKETVEGWTAAGHLTNAYDGWLQVNLN